MFVQVGYKFDENVSSVILPGQSKGYIKKKNTKFKVSTAGDLMYKIQHS